MKISSSPVSLQLPVSGKDPAAKPLAAQTRSPGGDSIQFSSLQRIVAAREALETSQKRQSEDPATVLETLKKHTFKVGETEFNAIDLLQAIADSSIGRDIHNLRALANEIYGSPSVDRSEYLVLIRALREAGTVNLRDSKGLTPIHLDAAVGAIVTSPIGEQVLKLYAEQNLDE
ncbi:MAG TPA: hypothetical protein V6C52_14180 [Coleofasciculaceae cyanobacterium]|jgi:hypothetical protein